MGTVSHEAIVRDEIPVDWRVLTEYSDDVVSVEQAGDRQYVHFGGSVAPDDTDGRTFRYLVEAPDTTGTYEFGPAAAKSGATDDNWVAFGGTDTNGVVGEDT